MSVQRGLVRPDGSSSILPAGVYDMTQLDNDLDEALNERVSKLMAKLDPRESFAQFKLEVFFRSGARRNVPVRGIASFFTNGGYLNGGGDASIYLCPQELEQGPCLAPLDAQFITHNGAVCPKCRRVSKTDDLVGQLIFDVPMQRWATLLVRFFHALECNADLVVYLERGSIQEAARIEREEHKHGEAYARVNAQRQMITYSLASIIQDTSGGKGLEATFRSFLEA